MLDMPFCTSLWCILFGLSSRRVICSHLWSFWELLWLRPVRRVWSFRVIRSFSIISINFWGVLLNFWSSIPSPVRAVRLNRITLAYPQSCSWYETSCPRSDWGFPTAVSIFPIYQRHYPSNSAQWSSFWRCIKIYWKVSHLLWVFWCCECLGSNAWRMRIRYIARFRRQILRNLLIFRWGCCIRLILVKVGLFFSRVMLGVSWGFRCGCRVSALWYPPATDSFNFAQLVLWSSSVPSIPSSYNRKSSETSLSWYAVSFPSMILS